MYVAGSVPGSSHLGGNQRCAWPGGGFGRWSLEEIPDGMEKPEQRGQQVRKEAVQKERRGESGGSHGQPVSAGARLVTHPLQHRPEGHEGEGRRKQERGETRKLPSSVSAIIKL